MCETKKAASSKIEVLIAQLVALNSVLHSISKEIAAMRGAEPQVLEGTSHSR